MRSPIFRPRARTGSVGTVSAQQFTTVVRVSIAGDKESITGNKRSATINKDRGSNSGAKTCRNM
jgi:hypothetical protein